MAENKKIREEIQSYFYDIHAQSKQDERMQDLHLRRTQAQVSSRLSPFFYFALTHSIKCMLKILIKLTKIQANPSRGPNK